MLRDWVAAEASFCGAQEEAEVSRLLRDIARVVLFCLSGLNFEGLCSRPVYLSMVLIICSLNYA